MEILKLADLSDSKVAPFAVLHAEKVGHVAKALKMTLAAMEAKPGVKEVRKGEVRGVVLDPAGIF